MADLSKKELLDAIEHGHAWYEERIKEELQKIIDSSLHVLNWDANENFHYLYDLECYLYVEKGLISLISYRANMPSTEKTFDHAINSVDDIKAAYQHFVALTLEE